MIGQIVGGISSLIGSGLSYAQGQKNIQLQKKFAKKGITWKVNDAINAGVHPIYAMGAQTNPFQPISIGAAGDQLAAAGQQIGGAIDAGLSKNKKAQMMAETLMANQVERSELENDLLRSRIARMNQPGIGPGLPNSADGNLIRMLPQDRTTSRPGAPDQEPGDVPDRGWAVTRTGRYAPVYSQDVKDRLEDDWIGSIAWNLRNRLIPFAKAATGQELKGPSHVKLKPGEFWSYDPFNNEYYIAKPFGKWDKGAPTVGGETASP